MPLCKETSVNATSRPAACPANTTCPASVLSGHTQARYTRCVCAWWRGHFLIPAVQARPYTVGVYAPPQPGHPGAVSALRTHSHLYDMGEVT